MMPKAKLLIVLLIFIAGISAPSSSAHAASHLAGQPEAYYVGPAALPPAFTASPFANQFVTTGAEDGTPGEHYFPSNGDGTFGAKSNIPGLGNVDGTDVADMDGDGDLDFLMCDGNAGKVYLYTNNGGGSFTPTSVASSITDDGFCTNLRIDDFNKDGLNDFVVGDNRNSILGTKVYLQGPTIGTFTASATLDTTWTDFGNNLFGVATGDINGDGNVDILMLGYLGTGAGEVRFYAGDGTGNFALPTLLFDIGTDFGVTGTVGLALFDLDGDGDLDIIAGGGTGGTQSDDPGKHFIYTNNGTGSFTKPATVAFDVDAQTGIDAYDADGDGHIDLMVATFGTKTLLYVRNLGGTLAAPVVVDSLTGPSIGVGAPPALGDRDQDGVPDPVDNCRFDPNPDQADFDVDGVGNACDNCEMVKNADQADTNKDGIGDACQQNAAGKPPFEHHIEVVSCDPNSRDCWIRSRFIYNGFDFFGDDGVDDPVNLVTHTCQRTVWTAENASGGLASISRHEIIVLPDDTHRYPPDGSAEIICNIAEAVHGNCASGCDVRGVARSQVQDADFNLGVVWAVPSNTIRVTFQEVTEADIVERLLNPSVCALTPSLLNPLWSLGRVPPLIDSPPLITVNISGIEGQVDAATIRVNGTPVEVTGVNTSNGTLTFQVDGGVFVNALGSGSVVPGSTVHPRITADEDQAASCPAAIGLPLEVVPDSVDCKKTEAISVNVFSSRSPDFDARVIDPTSARFGKTGTEAAPIKTFLFDLNRDGLLDRIFIFSTKNVVSCNDIPAGQRAVTITVRLKATPVDGSAGPRAFEGEDTLRVLKK